MVEILISYYAATGRVGRGLVPAATLAHGRSARFARKEPLQLIWGPELDDKKN
jgi:hypothetical protein